MDGDPNTGFLVGITQTFPEGVAYGEYRIGGTSLSSPLFAGVMALSDDLWNMRHGFINPVLYSRLLGSPVVSDITHVAGGVIRVDYVNTQDAVDGLVTSVRAFDDQGLAIRTRKGYDDVTGIGVPKGPWFLFFV